MLWILRPNLTMSGQGHVPAPIINGGGDSLSKWLNFRLSRARDLDLDLGLGHTAVCIPSCITRRPLPTYQISLKSKKLFVDVRTYGHLRLTLLGRLGGVDLKRKT